MKPVYAVSLDAIVAGLTACLSNGDRLVRASERLLPDFPSLTLSIAVLSLEEAGKLLFIDGLLFAQADDYKVRLFREGRTRHQRKLFSLIRFPGLIFVFARMDSRWKTDLAFYLVVCASVNEWNNARKALAPWLGPDAALDKLDAWKQKGFYTEIMETQALTPENSIPRESAIRVVDLARKTIDLLRFVLGNVDCYRKWGERKRAEMTSEADLQHLTKEAEALVKSMFGLIEPQRDP